LRVLIIGGTGVLSRAIALEAIAGGHQVTILTDGLGSLPEPSGLEGHLIADRRDGNALVAALSKTGVELWDLVVDAICYNERQATSLLSAIKNKSRHTVIISTAILYDRRNPLPLGTDSPLAPPCELGEYGIGKATMEQMWLEAAKAIKHPVTILRLPHILGVGCELGLVPLHNRDPLLLQRLFNHQPLLLADGGRQLLQVVFNDDVAKVILTACGNPLTFGKIYNCASPEIVTGLKYFETISQLLGVELTVENVPSEAIWNSDWGWSPTTISRILELDTLRSDVGVIPSTPLIKAIEVSLLHLQSRSHSHESSDNCNFNGIRKAINHNIDVIGKLLSNNSNKRVRTIVDERMNTNAPSFRL